MPHHSPSERRPIDLLTARDQFRLNRTALDRTLETEWKEHERNTKLPFEWPERKQTRIQDATIETRPTLERTPPSAIQFLLLERPFGRNTEPLQGYTFSTQRIEGTTITGWTLSKGETTHDLLLPTITDTNGIRVRYRNKYASVDAYIDVPSIYQPDPNTNATHSSTDIHISSIHDFGDERLIYTRTVKEGAETHIIVYDKKNKKEYRVPFTTPPHDTPALPSTNSKHEFVHVNGEEVLYLDGHTNTTRSIILTEDLKGAKRTIIGADGTISIFGLKKRKTVAVLTKTETMMMELPQLELPNNEPTSILDHAILADGSFLFVTRNGIYTEHNHIVHVTQKGECTVLENPELYTYPKGIVATPDGGFFVTLNTNKLYQVRGALTQPSPPIAQQSPTPTRRTF